MWTLIYILIFFVFLLAIAGVFFHILVGKIERLERKIIHVFTERTDVFPALYEVTSDTISRHKEIFSEILDLRKQEFSLSNMSNKIDGFFDLEGKIHHEINFIFQVCMKNPKLIRNGNFLYIRDIIMDKSICISKEIQKYRKAIAIYNKCIRYKNYTLIGFIIPYGKKSSI